ncbi:MAG: hypothetical protein HY369_04850 [Candidatus Aenigmarchaeota archaeon]|nr:hypothetical protein [Candidatus Aenigmarchaeota archaeon]
MRTHVPRKGQSAMEYLMTYGWAILIVIIVAAVLFSLGVFDPATYTTTAAVGFSGFNVPSGGFQLSSGGTLTVQMTNGVGATIRIAGAEAVVGATKASNTSAINGQQNVAPGDTITITIPSLGTKTAGSAYTADVKINFTNINTGLDGFKTTGTLSGTVS